METVNQEIQETTVDTVERTFTQAEVDAIVGDRLKRDRAKYADYDALKEKAGKYDELQEANKTELQKVTDKANSLEKELEALKSANTIRDIRAGVAERYNLPASLITGTTEEECTKQAEAIIEYAKPGAYPTVKDGGEVTRKHKLSTREQFKEWAETAFSR